MSTNQTNVLQDLSYLLGETSVPSSGIEDRQAFVQRALERVYRAYDWPMNKTTATIQLNAGIASLPTNVHQDSILDIRTLGSGVGADNVYAQIPYRDQDNFSAGTFRYWLTGYEGSYLLNTNETTNDVLTIYYEQTTPIINASISSPFPSSMTLARGALVYLRQAEDPQADVSQEEFLFQMELDEVIAQYNRSKPAVRGRTLHEMGGTHIGDIDDVGVNWSGNSTS